MRYEDDYVMRMIKALGQTMGAIVLGREKMLERMEEEQEAIVLTQEELLVHLLLKYLNSGDINKAENVLYTAMERDASPVYYEAGLYFYEEIGKWTDTTLAKYQFSRKEVEDGQTEWMSLYQRYLEEREKCQM